MSTPVGPYTPIVRAGPWLICSGQLGLAAAPAGAPPGPPALVAGGTVAQLTQALANTAVLLETEGASPGDVVKTTVFLADMDHYAEVNQAYSAFFGDHRPARSVLGVAALPMGAAVEVELWAYLDG
jgi:2-iminobutanoate/2-iminopropanoate deaminase